MKSNSSPIVFVVDDDAAVRMSLDALIRAAGLQVESFTSAGAFLNAYAPGQPGCLVLDVRLQGMGGLELQQELLSRGVNLPVIVMTGHGDVPVAVKAMKNGAFEFLEKPFSKQVFLEQVQRAIECDGRERTVGDAVQDVKVRLEQLTPRENDVLAGILAGKLSKQVANDLGVSKKTVDVHRANLMHKMGAQTVAGLVERVVLARPDMAVTGVAQARELREPTARADGR
jgi:FixJ family two-component response regulator